MPESSASNVIKGKNAHEDSAQDNHAILRREDGREEMIELVGLNEAKELLLSHENQNPADEFNALHAIDFKGDANGSFANDYADSAHSFEMMFRYSNDPQKLLNRYSCLYTKESGALRGEAGTLDVRSDGKGYAMVRLGQKRYLRMTTATSDPEQECVGSQCESVMRPMIYAKMFEKIDLDWKLTRELLAKTVIEGMAPNRHCR